MISANLTLQLMWLQGEIPEPGLPDAHPPDEDVAPPPIHNDPPTNPLPS